MAKLFASEICAEVSLEAMRIHGGYGYMDEYPISRMFRDQKVLEIARWLLSNID